MLVDEDEGWSGSVSCAILREAMLSRRLVYSEWKNHMDFGRNHEKPLF